MDDMDDMIALHHGDSLDVLPTLPAGSVDAVVTDPPYELGFMSRAWDASGVAYNVDLWREALRVLKPGGYLLAFGGTRTVHRLTCAIEDAGFEIRDGIDWLYGSGFPKSLDVSKAIDKAAGAVREVIGSGKSGGGRTAMNDAPGNGRQRDYLAGEYDVTAPATDDAARWSGWGTALKPAREPIVMARKPLAGTVAANVQAHGTGALNIDACRVKYEQGGTLATNPSLRTHINGGNGGEIIAHEPDRRVVIPNVAGRWPANVILSHTPDCAEQCVSGCPVAELGEPARFFPVFRYQAKAPTRERPKVDGVAHPTVKPLALMRWLVQLVTPPGGTVLDPFAGSGTTLEACALDGFHGIGIERDEPYLPLIDARMARIPRQREADAA